MFESFCVCINDLHYSQSDTQYKIELLLLKSIFIYKNEYGNFDSIFISTWQLSKSTIFALKAMLCAMLHLLVVSLLAVSLVVNSTIPFLQRHRGHAVVLAGYGGGDVLVVVLLIVRLLLVEEGIVVEEHLLGQVGGVGVVRHHVADVERQVSNSCALLVARLRPH